MAKGDAPTSCNDKEGKATGWHPADANPCALRGKSVAYRRGRFEPAWVDGSAWSFFEDVPRKPGWISSTAGSSIAFSISFSESPRFELSFLQSYTGMAGAVLNLTLGTCSASYELEGFFDEHVSVPYYFKLDSNVDAEFSCKRERIEPFPMHCGVEPGVAYEAAITHNGAEGKFKLLSLSTC